MSDLIERIERAGEGEQGLLLWEAWATYDDGSHSYFLRSRRFGTLVYDQAYVDAALMLVPEGMAWTIGYGQTLPDQLLYAAVIGRNAKWSGHGANYDAVAHSEGKTPALAITSAALKAKDVE